MKLRVVIYPISTLAFLPAFMALTLGSAVLPRLLANFFTGGLENLLMILLLVGGYVGVIAALLLTFDLGGHSLVKSKLRLKRLGIIAGILAESIVFGMLKPETSELLFFCLLPLVAGVALLLLSLLLAGTPAKTSR